MGLESDRRSSQLEGVIDDQQGINGVVTDDRSASRCSCWVGEHGVVVSKSTLQLEGVIDDQRQISGL